MKVDEDESGSGKMADQALKEIKDTKDNRDPSLRSG
jgi:hypothetical protein